MLKRKFALTLIVLLYSCGDDLGWSSDIDVVVDCDPLHKEDIDEDIIQDIDAWDVDDDSNSSRYDDADSTNDTEDSNGADIEVITEDIVLPEDTTDAVDTSSEIDSVISDSDTYIGLPPECTQSTDCPDLGQCTYVWCEEEKCHKDINLMDNMPCALDDTVCTMEKCLDGKCLSAGALPCFDDGNPCTDNVCDAEKGCEVWANTSPCDDGSACTIGDACVSGVCLPGAVTQCDDQNVCTDDNCTPTVGCISLPNTASCTDSNACTDMDTCAQGTCVGVTTVCDDANTCTNDTCEAVLGCSHDPNVNACQDNNPCTEFDFCEGGLCVAGSNVTCDDQNTCTTDFCDLSIGCTTTAATDGTICAQGYCFNGTCSCKAFGCAAPKFIYSGDITAGMLGGMGGGVGPKMGCPSTDVLIGIGFDFSSSTKTVTRTTVVCGKVEADAAGVVVTTKTTTQKSGGSGCSGWDPSVTTPLVTCPTGWVIVGIEGKNAPGTLFHSVSVTCSKMDVGGKPTTVTQTVPVPTTNAAGGTPKSVLCPFGTVARYFETRAGCGQDALILYCAKSSPDCAGQPPICVE